MYRTLFTVSGGGLFPIDMLRYCAAFPWEERESYKIQTDDATTRTVTLARHHIDKDPAVPQTLKDRWESFSWRFDRVLETTWIGYGPEPEEP